MVRDMEGISRDLLGAADEISSMTELGEAVSRLLGSVVAHDGYAYRVGRLDPVTGPVILGVRGEGYSPRALLRLERHCRANRDLYPPFTQRRGICSVGAFGSRSAKTERHADLYATMAADGVGADLRIALTVRYTSVG
jgi:hypothetical protein